MKVNMLEAKNQLSRPVKRALAGAEVVIASTGEPMVRLVPVGKLPIAASRSRDEMRSAGATVLSATGEHLLTPRECRGVSP